jgi:hypothetical protein
VTRPPTTHQRRRIIVFAASIVVAVALSAGGAYAYLTSSGQGTGSAPAGTLQPVTVAAFVGGDSPTSALLPGGPSADVILRINNANSFAVTLVSVTGNGTITADAGHGSCTTTGVTFTNQPSLSISLPAGGSLVHLSGAAGMSTASSNGCQGATFNIPVSITVHKP